MVRLALDDAAVWIESGMDDDEAAVLFGHRLVSIHPLPNGNGRQVRAQYLSAVRAADRGDITPLLAFART